MSLNFQILLDQFKQRHHSSVKFNGSYKCILVILLSTKKERTALDILGFILQQPFYFQHIEQHLIKKIAINLPYMVFARGHH